MSETGEKSRCESCVWAVRLSEEKLYCPYWRCPLGEENGKERKGSADNEPI